MSIDKKFVNLVVIIFSFLLIICCINNQYEDEKERNKVYLVEGLDGNSKGKGGFMGTGYSTTELMFIGLIPVVLCLIAFILVLKFLFNIFFGSSDD